MDEQLQQIANMLMECEDFPMESADPADAQSIVDAVREVLNWLAAARNASRSNATARDAYLSGMNEAREELAKANRERDAILKAYNDKSVESMKKADALRAELESANCALGIAQAERDVAMDALSERSEEAAGWREASHKWEARYEGVCAALRVVLEVR